MTAETVTCAKGNTYKLHKEHVLTDKKDVSAKPVPVESTKAIVLFIGGAGLRRVITFLGLMETFWPPGLHLINAMSR
ncbi:MULTISPECIES: hypothetical protein [Pseudomonas fluorescens group]|uniref:hypothetical protein n=1 Tax=Pseudomonas fluorescens group TaxID=136843 RepID=UPI00087D02E4|nr:MULTISPECIES: hypothetical protein [Pseudomonas fluorescens group]SDU17980.1 hypothetical protein SAMN04490196_0851 [Pseudomonas moraviensis]